MSKPIATPEEGRGFIRELGLIDSIMVVAGSMIGSGIFIVSAGVVRQLGSAGWLLAAWVFSGLLIAAAATSYGELAAMMPQVGGQYVYLRETYSPLMGFLFGWAMFMVIQSGTIAAVAVAFSRFLGVLVPAVSSTAWIVEPVALSDGYAVSLSAQQLVAILLIVFLTFVNTRGIKTGKRIQNVFTWTKTLALLALIVLGLAAGRAVGNFEDLWTPAGAVTTVTVTPDLPGVPAVNASEGGFALFAVFILALVGPLFSSGAWNDVSFAAAELRNPRRDLPIALVAGVVLVGILYLLTNLAYLRALPLEGIRNAADDRVATAVLDTVLGGGGAAIMAIAIMISTFGCNNGLILAGARIYYAMACDGLFFRGAGRLNRQNVPAVGLAIQGVWASLLVLPRTRSVDEAGVVQYGNLYSNLLEYVIFAVLLFYILAIIGVFVLRRTRPDAERPYRAFGYPVVPAFYIVGASLVVLALLVYRTQTTWPGLLLVLAGIPFYFFWKKG